MQFNLRIFVFIIINKPEIYFRIYYKIYCRKWISTIANLLLKTEIYLRFKDFIFKNEISRMQRDGAIFTNLWVSETQLLPCSESSLTES